MRIPYLLSLYSEVGVFCAERMKEMKAGSKLDKALKYGVAMLTEAQFELMLAGKEVNAR
jgi:hypothetical protein